MIKICTLFVFLLLAGCGVKTKIQPMPDGGYIIESKSDALVMVDGEKVTVDNRGKLSVIEQLIGLMFINTEKKIGVTD